MWYIIVFFSNKYRNISYISVSKYYYISLNSWSTELLKNTNIYKAVKGLICMLYPGDPFLLLKNSTNNHKNITCNVSPFRLDPDSSRCLLLSLLLSLSRSDLSRSDLSRSDLSRSDLLSRSRSDLSDRSDL